ncbi:MAG: hypothetical protein R3E45_06360 [Rhodocyclaceae bacterium]
MELRTDAWAPCGAARGCS